MAWGVILWLLASFQARFASAGRVATALGSRSYAIFVIHPPIVVAAALLFRATEAAPLVKFAAVTALSSLVCFLVAGLILRVPAVARIL